MKRKVDWELTHEIFVCTVNPENNMDVTENMKSHTKQWHEDPEMTHNVILVYDESHIPPATKGFLK